MSQPKQERDAAALQLMCAAIASGRDTTPDEFAHTAYVRADALYKASKAKPSTAEAPTS